MAENAVIGALRIVLGADTAALETGLKSAQSSLNSFAASMSTSLKVAGAAMVAGMGAIGLSIKSTIDEADKMGKMAQSVGLPVEELSKLKYAADLSDVSMETLGKSLGKLSKNMSEVAGGATGPAAEAFKALGISVKNTDGTMKSSSTVLDEVAEKFAGYRDGATKTALAMVLFGKSGADMIPLLNAGRDGIAEMKTEAEKLGIVLSKQTTDAAQEFNDNLTRMGAIKNGITIQITSRLVPAFEKLSAAMVAAAKDSSLMDQVATGLTTVMQSAISVAMGAAVTFQRLGAELAALWKVLVAPDWTSMKEAWANLAAEGLKTEAAFATLKQTVATMWDNKQPLDMSGEIAEFNKLQTAVQKYFAEWEKGEAPALKATSATQNALQSFLTSQEKRTAAQRAEIETVGKSVGEQTRLKLAYEASAIAQAAGIPITEEWRKKIEAAGISAGAAAEKLLGTNLIAQSQPAWQQYQTELANTEAAMRKADATQEELARGAEMVAQRFGMTWQQASSSIAGSFSEMANSMGKNNAKLVKSAQVFAAAQALISTLAGAADALKMGFPQNLAFSAAVLAKGMSLVAAIKSVNVPGFQTGGSFRVPGSGGPDSKRLMMDLTPGEQVDVWRPGERNGADPRGGASSVPTVPVVINGQGFSREGMRDFMDKLNDMFRDGYRLELAPNSR